MRTNYVILAAGRGTRLGKFSQEMPKALLPLGTSTALSELIQKAPDGARIYICVGHLGDMIRQYVQHAHATRDIVFVDAHPDRVAYGAGPGGAVLAAEGELSGGDTIIVCCDTLWDDNVYLFNPPVTSWLGTAPVTPSRASALDRWCRVVAARSNGQVLSILDKTNTDVFDSSQRTLHEVWTGLAYIVAKDMPAFMSGLKKSIPDGTERQLSLGFNAIIDKATMRVQRLSWIDIGEVNSYLDAIAVRQGADWAKPRERTFIVDGRVIKVDSSPAQTRLRAKRGEIFTRKNLAPKSVLATNDMYSHEFIAGETVYKALSRMDITTSTGMAMTTSLINDLVTWWRRTYNLIPPPSTIDLGNATDGYAFANDMYYGKTMERAASLHARPDLYRRVMATLVAVDWHALSAGVVFGYPHGDFTFSNIIVTSKWSNRANTPWQFAAVDWRPAFGSVYTRPSADAPTTQNDRMHGDLRYDLGKLLTSVVVHWDNARNGDLRPWRRADLVKDLLEKSILDDGRSRALWQIAALCLISSAPLHPAPFSDVLAVRGVELLERTL